MSVHPPQSGHSTEDFMLSIQDTIPDRISNDVPCTPLSSAIRNVLNGRSVQCVYLRNGSSFLRCLILLYDFYVF